MEPNTGCIPIVLYLLAFVYLAGVPTLRQQAELFIRSLRLGANAEEPTDNPATTPTTLPTPRTTRPPTTRPTPRTTRPPTTRPTPWTTQPPTTRPTPRPPVPASHIVFLLLITSPTPRTTQPPTTSIICYGRKKRFTVALPTGFPIATVTPSSPFVTCSVPTSAPPNITLPPLHPYRGRRNIPTGSEYCPSLEEQANNRICPNVCPRGMYVRK